MCAQRKKHRRRWLFAALALCAAVFLISGGVIAQSYIRSSSERNANLRLAEQVHEAKQQASPAPEAAAPAQAADSAGSALPEPEELSILPQYEALWQQNHDLGGWLYAEGTNIDYPVMYTPDEPEYYLRRAFDGSDAHSGSLFISEGCTPDSSHVIIYGHNMKDETMFSTLTYYADAEFAQAHPVIAYDTLTTEGTYEVVAAFYSEIDRSQNENVFRYYEYTDLSQREVFEEYVRQVKAASRYDTGVDVQYGDQLLTLSTCSYHADEGRFVVVARRLEP